MTDTQGTATNTPTATVGVTILPGQLIHARDIFSPIVNPGVAPGLLVHTRAIFSPIVNVTLFPGQLMHTRDIFAPTVSVPPVGGLFIRDNVPTTLSG